MSAPITEAHGEAAVAIFAIAMKSSHHGAPFREPCAQLIADSEARAVASAVTMLTCTHHNDQQRAACPVCLVAALTAIGVLPRAKGGRK